MPKKADNLTCALSDCAHCPGVMRSLPFLQKTSVLWTVDTFNKHRVAEGDVVCGVLVQSDCLMCEALRKGKKVPKNCFNSHACPGAALYDLSVFGDVPPKAKTCAQQSVAALRNAEGWDVFEVSNGPNKCIAIQKLDNPDDGPGAFETDLDAVAHVIKMAKAGSALHREACRECSIDWTGAD